MSKKKDLRGSHAYESLRSGAVVVYATMPDGDGEPILVEPHRVHALMLTCTDAMAKEPSIR